MQQHRSFALLLIVCVAVWAVPQTKQADYSVNIHITGSRMVLYGDSALHHQYLNVTIDGKKYELSQIGSTEQLLMLGDYKARLLTDEHGKGDYDSRQIYEFQFPDGKTRRFLVVGQLE
jgi:hypothetical protein